MILEKQGEKDQRRSCQLTLVQLKRGLILLSCIQLIRASWQVWGCFDRRWPASIDGLIPMIYISCSLVIALTLVSASTTYSVYRTQPISLMVGWWCYYILTVFCAINNFIFLSLLCMNKRLFIRACHMDPKLCRGETDTGCHGGQKDNHFLEAHLTSTCFRIWQEAVIWVVLDAMMNLIINIMFIYILYRCRNDHYRFNQLNHVHPSNSYPTVYHHHHHHNIHTTTMTTDTALAAAAAAAAASRPASSLPAIDPYHPSSRDQGNNNDEFQVIELK